MMDYYEELGIERSATLVEVRHAYRRLMQLVHPDHSGDEATRRLAELQAKRLNAILAVLADPVERERYDRELSFGQTALALAPPPRERLAQAPGWLWLVAGAAVAMAFISVMPRSQRGDQAVEAPPPQASPVPVSKNPPRPATGSYARALPRQWTPPAAAAASGPEAGDISSHAIPTNLAPGLPPEAPPASEASRNDWETPALIAPALAEPPHPPRCSTLAGEWLFVPQPIVHGNGLYPPEYIEMRVTEGAGTVRGKYRARYRISDRAISPEVAFEFQGRASESDARLPWTGPGGTRGEVTLHLVTAGALEVTWVVSQTGGELGLISGTATLVRKME
jgi:hypothetical protein